MKKQIREEDRNSSNDEVCDGRQRRFPLAINGSKPDIYKASLTCRFAGDMGDKYWSAYLLIYLPRSSRLLEDSEAVSGLGRLRQWFHESTRNDQRKILEPFLVEKMIAEVYQSTNNFLTSIDDWLDPDVEASKAGKGSTSSDFFKADDRNFDAQ